MASYIIIGTQYQCAELDNKPEYTRILDINTIKSEAFVKNIWITSCLNRHLNKVQVNEVLNNPNKYMHGFKFVINNEDDNNKEYIIYAGNYSPAGYIFSESVDNEHKVYSFQLTKYTNRVLTNFFLDRKEIVTNIDFINELKEKTSAKKSDSE